jgi:hypothetical protein
LLLPVEEQEADSLEGGLHGIGPPVELQGGNILSDVKDAFWVVLEIMDYHPEARPGGSAACLDGIKKRATVSV